MTNKDNKDKGQEAGLSLPARPVRVIVGAGEGSDLIIGSEELEALKRGAPSDAALSEPSAPCATQPSAPSEQPGRSDLDTTRE